MNRDPRPQNQEELLEIIRKGEEVEAARPPLKRPSDSRDTEDN